MIKVQPGHFAVGTLASVDSLSLVLAVSKRRHDFLVSPQGADKWAIAIDPAGDFNAFKCNEAVNHWGVIIPDIRIEVDLNSRVDFYDSTHGSLVRSGEYLNLFAKQGTYGRSLNLIPLLSDLEKRDSGEMISFTRWQIVIPGALRDTILYEMDVTHSKSEA